jgi:hypothetical protein
VSRTPFNGQPIVSRSKSALAPSGLGGERADDRRKPWRVWNRQALLGVARKSRIFGVEAKCNLAGFDGASANRID